VTSTGEAVAFVRLHGVVLASGKGAVPRLTDFIAGRPIKGSWWSDPAGKEIFQIFRALSEYAEILACRLVDGKVTYVHRRLWPALVRVADHFTARQLAQVHEEHTAAGHHVTRDIAFPQWVPAEVLKEAALLSEAEALTALGLWAAGAIS
jgi:hypothetical protein